jgi:uncharacterized membrane protein (UPF0127 family)
VTRWNRFELAGGLGPDKGSVRRRIVTILGGLALTAAACDRSEGIHATAAAGAAPARPAPATAGTSAVPLNTAPPAATGTSAEPRPCLVETPAEAPAPQEPASVCPSEPEPAPALERAAVSFPAAPGQPRVNVEVARQPKDHARGLMYRTSMPADQGMLFSWVDERVRSFWMHNTCIPLDMLFLSRDGMVVGIQEQVPVLNDRSRSIPCPAAYVLEVNAGWCRQHGVRAGMRAVIE